ncbi:MAG: NADP-dependent oxidoreductase, partial [Gammaproteobacteria bacterium]
MSTRTNHRWLLRSRPDGIVTSDLFERDEIEVPELKDGQVLAQTLYLSFDPTQRAWMAMETYMPIIEIGE